MATFGVQPTGFVVKPLTVALAEIEANCRLVFGDGVIQTPQSPLGQLNGLNADIISQAWEIGLDTYQSYDPDAAEGVPLQRLGKIRLLDKLPTEADADYRQAITNTGRARIDIQDLTRAVKELTGVTFVQVFINESDVTDADGLTPHSISVAVLGGSDDEIAKTVRDFAVPGIPTSGNLRVDTLIEGFCRSIWITRPTVVQVSLNLNVRLKQDRNGCPPPAPASIAAGLVQDLMGELTLPDGQRAPRKLVNGADVTDFALRSTLEARYPNVEYVSATAAFGGGNFAPVPRTLLFTEIAEFAAVRTTIVPVP